MNSNTVAKKEMLGQGNMTGHNIEHILVVAEAMKRDTTSKRIQSVEAIVAAGQTLLEEGRKVTITSIVNTANKLGVPVQKSTIYNNQPTLGQLVKMFATIAPGKQEKSKKLLSHSSDEEELLDALSGNSRLKSMMRDCIIAKKNAQAEVRIANDALRALKEGNVFGFGIQNGYAEQQQELLERSRKSFLTDDDKKIMADFIEILDDCGIIREGRDFTFEGRRIGAGQFVKLIDRLGCVHDVTQPKMYGDKV